MSELQQLEKRKQEVAEQLKDVERQIYDLETKYLQKCNPQANALTGYTNLMAAAPASKEAPVDPSLRLFSGSSVTWSPNT